MYRLTSVYAIPNTPKGQWGEIEFAELTGKQLYQLYRSAYLTLESDLLQDPVTIDAGVYYAPLSSQDKKLTEIFDEWTDTTALKAVDKPSYVVKKALFTDAFRAGYMVHKSMPGAHRSAGNDNRQKTEMQISRSGTDMRLFEKYCLISANGYFYRVQADQDIAYIQEAGKTLLKSRYNHVGILSFQQIAPIKTYPIEGDVLSLDPQGSKSQGVNIALPVADLKGKSLLLCLMGYLHLPGDGVYQAVSEDRAHVKLNRINLAERYKESRQFVDWSSVVENQSQAAVDGRDLFSDESVDQIFKHPQTFWVVVDTPSLRVVKEPARTLPLPGQYIHHEEPVGLLTTGEGRVMEYWKRYYDQEWAIYVSGVRPGRSMHATVGRGVWGGQFSIRDTAYNSTHNQDASFIDILADVKIK